MLNRIRNGSQRIIRNQYSLKPLVELVNADASQPFSSLSNTKQPVNQSRLPCSQWQKHSQGLPSCSFYSTDNERQSENENVKRALPKLSDEPIIATPGLFSFFSVTFNAIKVRNQLDGEFSLDDFIDGSKRAVAVISDKMASADFDGLRGLVTDKVIDDLQNPIVAMTEEQRSHLRVLEDDIVAQFVSSIDIREDEDRKFVDIFTILQVVLGYKQLTASEEKKSPLDFLKQTSMFVDNNLYVLNYKFTREYSENSSGDWIVSFINHANIEDQMNDQMNFFKKSFEDKGKK
ncbi:uncharacterized protein LOC116352348 [Contarinia nasturtii]|uniref:uncharacterized protein LOC116352348 n=1 Tax=Contarinia nasturtii TaxID=265458 RepID=UPI0012D4BBD4|nr:uncharacterized protein LOC116352348 [Contarinia nasturtii]